LHDGRDRRAHANEQSKRKSVSELKAPKKLDYISSTGRAAGTMYDFIYGRQGALWMTSSMDATKRGQQSDLKQNKNHHHGNVFCFVLLLVHLKQEKVIKRVESTQKT
jgi:hypothetical protein